MALPGVPKSKLVLNVVCGRSRLSSSVLPEKFNDCRLITIVMENAPFVNPFNMKEMGPIAYTSSKAGMISALCNEGHIQQVNFNHWCVFVDCSQKNISPTIPQKIESITKISDLKSTFSFVKRSSYEELVDVMSSNSNKKKRARDNEISDTKKNMNSSKKRLKSKK